MRRLGGEMIDGTSPATSENVRPRDPPPDIPVAVAGEPMF
jgi:hypothetical protein